MPFKDSFIINNNELYICIYDNNNYVNGFINPFVNYLYFGFIS